MPTHAQPGRSERDQTDDSLRAEREKADRTLDDDLSAIDELADAIISRARMRADEVLAAARATTDRQAARGSTRPQPDTIRRERALEDHVLQEERANADETLRGERADHVALLSRERHETDRDLSNERARSDDALATRDEFLGTVSHELRNMLNTMAGSASLIASVMSQENHVAQTLVHAGRIQRSAVRMERLIGDLVDVACIDAGMLVVTREIGDPAHVAVEAVETFQAQALTNGIAVTSDIAAPSSIAAFDPSRILQVLTNLLGNAIKFTPPHGHVVVRVERIGDDIRFAVSDTGVGIPAEQLETVFGRFRQVAKNDRRGVGLGLYISKCIVQGHGGRIWAENRDGGGSTFCFTIPVHVAD